jgi:hypothetical protein
MKLLLSRKSGTSRAILNALNRWEALTRYCDDGRLEIDNLPIERAPCSHALRTMQSTGSKTCCPGT